MVAYNTLCNIGFVMYVIGWLWLVGLASEQSTRWGLACFFIPGVALIFAIKHWGDAKLPFFINLSGDALIVLGLMTLSPSVI